MGEKSLSSLEKGGVFEDFEWVTQNQGGSYLDEGDGQLEEEQRF